jgi:cold shock CspA family protein
MARGTIVRAIDAKGICWIQEDNGPQLFALRSEFQNTNVSFLNIAGARVDFSVKETARGFQARTVEIIIDPAGRNYGTIARLIRSGGGFIEGYGAPDRGIFFPVDELLGDDWPDDLRGTEVSYTVGTDKQGRTMAVAIRTISEQGKA